MKYIIDDYEYQVEIIRKNNKNTYLRIKDNGVISVTTNYFVTKKEIIKILKDNEKFITRNFEIMKIKKERQSNFYYLGKSYDIVFGNINEVEIRDSKLICQNEEMLNKWLEEEIKRIFLKQVYFYFHEFEEDIPYPKLKFRKMKTRWGVCNKRDNSVTLNKELIKYDIECLNYVVVHELSHFIYFNHSRNFWRLVEKYIPNYKEIRKKLKY